jgi:septal ring factor EnvC (AmiA/AmiB activator)
MSKLEKIAELKIENSNIKMENKSLKKTVKKLLGQLTNAITEKNELLQSSQQQYSGDDDNFAPEDTPPLSPIEETHVKKVEGNSVLPRYLDETEGTVPASCEIDIAVLKDDSKAEKRLTMDSSTLTESITQLRQKLKKEEQAHKSTEYRLKAEIDILTNEVTGLQRELGLALQSLDETKERIRGSRESSHGLKREIRVVTARLKESIAEAEARDRLIDTFKGILLQKVGLDPANV